MSKEILIVCLQVFFCRILDVSLGTVRTVLTVQSKPAYASLIGFIETLLWFLVVRQALAVESSGIYTAIAYASGFAAGTFIGGLIARRFVRGDVTVQIVTTDRNDKLVSAIRVAGFGATVVDVRGSDYGCEKYMIFCEISSARLDELKRIVGKYDTQAFIMGQETKYVYNGFFLRKK
ncbi:MAG: DUF5698 domain-containing protein [Oscillospiraceae bacterium]